MLVGFDFVGSHFFGEHPKTIKITTPWNLLRTQMGDLARELHIEGCKVVNCSPISTLSFWPKKTLAAALPAG